LPPGIAARDKTAGLGKDPRLIEAAGFGAIAGTADHPHSAPGMIGGTALDLARFHLHYLAQ